MSKKNLIVVLLISLGLIIPKIIEAKNPRKEKRHKKEKTITCTQNNENSSKGSFKSYCEVITKDAKTSKGFIDVHYVKDKYYFEIPDSLMGRDILVVNRISKAPVNPYKSTVGYPGDQIGENVIRFEKGPNNKIFIRNISYLEQAKDTLGMFQSVKNSNVQPIVATFDLQTVKKDSTNTANSSVIDVTNFLQDDNDVFFFNNRLKKIRGIGAYLKENSYIDSLYAFPINVEIKTVKTYFQTTPKGYPDQIADSYPNGPITYELNSSMVLLPKEPMKARFFDPRVAYFAVRYTDFDANPQGIEYKAKITRWRLEPKDEDIEKYKRGELVEPKKPIIFYIDPATPRKWVPYLIAGVNDWQASFEQAGFKNAIYAMEAPKDDRTWSLEDARHSAIVYKPSDISNASGPHVHDPRSGEIMETHINWYHNVMLLLRNWYMVQAGAIDPGARTVNFDDDLMGQLIRFVSSHEVGHTLGLRHNWGSSHTVPVEKLRDKAWVEANGHTPSIMDYARFNYVAQPEDSISRAGIFPRIGIYDKWSVEWGYKYLPQFETAEEETPFLNRWVISKLEQDVRYTFGTERDPDDPRNQNEDLGDNAMLASMYGIKNLKRIVPNILEWTREPNKGYASSSNLYDQIVIQYGRYMGHVAKNIGGIYNTPRTVEEKGNSKEFVSATIQKEAVLFLNDNLFTTPIWLIDQELITKAGVDPVKSISDVQKKILDRLISVHTINKMQNDEAYNGLKAYSAENMFKDLKKGVWAELYNGKTIDIYRRNLQKNYVEALILTANIKPANKIDITPNPTDATSIARGELITLRRDIRNVIGSTTGLKRAHLQDLVDRIDIALDTTK